MILKNLTKILETNIKQVRNYQGQKLLPFIMHEVFVIFECDWGGKLNWCLGKEYIGIDPGCH